MKLVKELKALFNFCIAKWYKPSVTVSSVCALLATVYHLHLKYTVAMCTCTNIYIILVINHN